MFLNVLSRVREGDLECKKNQLKETHSNGIFYSFLRLEEYNAKANTPTNST